MRSFCMAMVLVNVLAFAYQTWIIEPDVSVDALSLEQGYPRLEIVKIVRVKPDNTAEDIFNCLKIGPLEQEDDAVAVAETLEARGAVVVQTSGAGNIWVGHWVQVDGQSSRPAAEVARDELVHSGLQDAYIVPGAEDHRISLGVFRSKLSAELTISKAAALGYNTRMDERYQSGTVYWLSVRLPAERELQPGELKSDTGQILRTETVLCEAAGL